MINNINFSYDLLVGLDVIHQFKLIQDKKLNFYQKVDKKKELISLREIIEKKEEIKQNKFEINYNENISTETFEADLSHLELKKRNKIKELIAHNNSIIATNKYDVGRVQDFEAQIRLSEYKYISKKAYRMSRSKRN